MDRARFHCATSGRWRKPFTAGSPGWTGRRGCRSRAPRRRRRRWPPQAGDAQGLRSHARAAPAPTSVGTLIRLTLRFSMAARLPQVLPRWQLRSGLTGRPERVTLAPFSGPGDLPRATVPWLSIDGARALGSIRVDCFNSSFRVFSPARRRGDEINARRPTVCCSSRRSSGAPPSSRNRPACATSGRSRSPARFLFGAVMVAPLAVLELRRLGRRGTFPRRATCLLLRCSARCCSSARRFSRSAS